VDCTSPTLQPGSNSPADLIQDEEIKRIITDVSSGTFTASSYQIILTKLGITDVIVDIVGQPSCDDKNGKVVFTITITGSRTLTEYIADLNKALADRFGIKIDQIITILEAADTSAVKKRVGPSEGSYLQTSIIEPPVTPTANPTANPTGNPTANPTGNPTATPTIWYPIPASPADAPSVPAAVLQPSSGVLLTPVWLFFTLLSFLLMRR
jgi:hypothetical protein